MITTRFKIRRITMPQADPFSLNEFSDLVREHQSGLRAFIRALGVETDWVDDIAQEVFVIAYRRREHFDNDVDALAARRFNDLGKMVGRSVVECSVDTLVCNKARAFE